MGNGPFYDWANWHKGGDLSKRKYYDLDVTLDFIQNLLQQHAPIDGVCGFSQGSNMANLLAAQAVAGEGVNFNFVIHACGGGPGWTEQRPDLYPTKLSMPSLHISGEMDA